MKVSAKYSERTTEAVRPSADRNSNFLLVAARRGVAGGVRAANEARDDEHPAVMAVGNWRKSINWTSFSASLS